MNIELLEHELVLLNNKQVIVVRPNFGHQSDSWYGHLYSNDEYPRKFTFNGNDFSMIFFAEDVVKIDESSSSGITKIIRLKGPYDYTNQFQNA